MCIKRTIVTVLFAGILDSAQALTVTNVPARGVWCSDFVATTNAARQASMPAIVFYGKVNCPYCDRLRLAIDRSKAFGSWQRARGLYMVLATKEASHDGFHFVQRTPKRLINSPCVGIYQWDAEGKLKVSVNFVGRRDEMYVRKGRTIAEQLMNSVDAALASYLATSAGQSGASILAEAVSHISVTNVCEGSASGTVRMRPESGVLREGGIVSLTAQAGEGATLAGWIDPSGRFFGAPSRLGVGSSMPEGLYRAVFRMKADCVAPTLQLPTNVVVMTAGNLEECDIPVNPKARPVAFEFTGLPSGLRVSKSVLNGTLGGVPDEVGDYDVRVKVKSLVHPEWTDEGTFKIKVKPLPSAK